MKGWLREWVAWLVDFPFPRRCVFCRARVETDLPCPDCQRDLPWLTEREAERRYEFVSCCASALRYRDGVRRSVLNLKFHRRIGFIRTMGPITAQCAQDHLAGRFDLITWVPLAPGSLRDRGFDQARLLAEHVAGAFQMKPTATMKKRDGVRRQSGIRDPVRRRANVLGAYSMLDKVTVEGKRVLLVDDVVTTGSTLSECARVLRTAGCDDVVAVTLARAGK